MRIAAMVVHAGSKEQAQIGAGVGISYGPACDIHRALSEAERIIEELRKP